MKHELARILQLTAVLSGLFAKFIATGHLIRPKENLLFRLGQFASGGNHLVVNLFQQTGYGSENGGMDLIDIVDDGAQAFGVINRDAEVLPGINHHTFIYVAQRQIAQHARLGVYRHNRTDGLEVADDVAMGELNAFHGAGGARSVNNGHYIVGRDAVLDVVEILRTGVGAAQGDNFVEVAVAAQVPESIDVILQIGDFSDDVFDFAENVPAGNEHHLHIRMM